MPVSLSLKRFFLLALFVLSPVLFAGPQEFKFEQPPFPGFVRRHFKIDLGGGTPTYFATIIEYNHFFLSPTFEIAESNYSENMRLSLRAREWTFEQFKFAYPDYPPAEFEKMKAEHELFPPYSSRIILTKGDPNGEIVGTLQLVYGSEEGLAVKLPNGKKWRYRGPRWHWVAHSNGSSELYGGVIQAREFVAKEPLVSSILHFTASQLAMDYSALPTATVTENLAREYRSIPLQYRSTPPRATPLFPLKIVAVWDSRLGDYYSRLGFKKIVEKPIAGSIFVSEIEIQDFVQIAKKNFIYRKGFEKIETSGIWWHYIDAEEIERQIFYSLKEGRFLVASFEGPKLPIGRSYYDTPGIITRNTLSHYSTYWSRSCLETLASPEKPVTP